MTELILVGNEFCAVADEETLEKMKRAKPLAYFIQDFMFSIEVIIGRCDYVILEDIDYFNRELAGKAAIHVVSTG